MLAHLLADEPLLRDRKRIWLLGAGKASAPMAQAVEKVCGKRIAGGCVVVKDGHGAPLRYAELRESGHPVPDERGVAAAKRIAEIARQATAEDLVICCISGGASALMPLPAPGITLILSDVIGDDLSTIGSGPTVADPSTLADVAAIFARYGIAPMAGMRETPKRLFGVTNRIVGSNMRSVMAAGAKATELGYRPLILSTTIEGETRDVARMHVAIAKESLRSGNPAKPPLCILSGGETTVNLRGSGKGGRNQEFALAAALDLLDEPRILVLSAGTDGTDGPTDAAGGFATSATAKDAQAARAALDNNDSYPFLEQTGDLLVTGPTRTNVMDIRILLVTQ